jgi:hypothetical protein
MLGRARAAERVRVAGLFRAGCLADWRAGWRAGWRARLVAAPREFDAARPRLAGEVRPAMVTP